MLESSVAFSYPPGLLLADQPPIRAIPSSLVSAGCVLPHDLPVRTRRAIIDMFDDGDPIPGPRRPRHRSRVVRAGGGRTALGAAAAARQAARPRDSARGEAGHPGVGADRSLLRRAPLFVRELPARRRHQPALAHRLLRQAQRRRDPAVAGDQRAQVDQRHHRALPAMGSAADSRATRRDRARADCQPAVGSTSRSRPAKKRRNPACSTRRLPRWRAEARVVRHPSPLNPRLAVALCFCSLEHRRQARRTIRGLGRPDAIKLLSDLAGGANAMSDRRCPQGSRPVSHSARSLRSRSATGARASITSDCATPASFFGAWS